jgi:hypothetical protein
MDRFQYAQASAEDRLRPFREQAGLGRGTKRIFQIASRRPSRTSGAR